MRELIKRNKARTPGICHSHDFCDANMAMLEAWTELTGQECVDGEDEAACRAWNAAWDRAIETEFSTEE